MDPLILAQHTGYNPFCTCSNAHFLPIVVIGCVKCITKQTPDTPDTNAKREQIAMMKQYPVAYEIACKMCADQPILGRISGSSAEANIIRENIDIVCYYVKQLPATQFYPERQEFGFVYRK